MNRILSYFLITIFSIFLGSQITEGCLLVPYWKTLSTMEFYEYYFGFGQIIGRFYTILTILAVLIPVCTSIYCYSKKSLALKYSLVSSFFSILVITVFYIYFKDTNQQFYDGILDAAQLQSELKIWGYWHWARVFFGILSIIFLILTFNILTGKISKSLNI